MLEVFGDLRGRTIAFIGDGNNVARSLAVGCAKLGVNFILAAPNGYGFNDQFLEGLAHAMPGGKILQNGKPAHAVRSADVIYTDVWASMGQEAERDDRLRHFKAYQVNEALLARAPQHARVMHCLPAHRGEEITDSVIDGAQSIVFEQAENRLWVQLALLALVFGIDPPVAAAAADRTAQAVAPALS